MQIVEITDSSGILPIREYNLTMTLTNGRESIIFHDLTAKYGIALCLKESEGGLNWRKSSSWKRNGW